MCEVLKNNFEEVFPRMESDIKNADFIALDTEFTGLFVSDQQKPSLFDSGEVRYKKLRNSVSKFSISQIGISAFIRDKLQNRYYAHTYNCYLYPAHFGPVDVIFSCQASSLQFLRQHDFDFNKFVYEGIPFMNDDQESALRAYLENQDHLQGLDRDVDEKALQQLCSCIADWLIKPDKNGWLQLDRPAILPEYVVIGEMRDRFPEIWPSLDATGTKIIVEKVSPEKRQELSQQFNMEQENKILSTLLGFTRVFRVLVTVKKPLIGHNCLMDLMLLYDKFYSPLPAKYSTFKEEITAMFPQLYDTKHISANIRKKYEETELFDSTGLGQLYQALNSQKGKFLVLYSPDIKFPEDFDRYKGNHVPHEAGYDSFMAGYVFIRIAHILAAENRKVTEPISFLEYLIAVRPYLNSVNLIRGVVDHVRLDDIDPKSRRPKYLFVRGRQTEPITASMVARLFSQYGSADVYMRGSRSALVAVSNHACAKDILRAFHNHDVLKVNSYHIIRHSRLIRGLMWGGVLLSGSACVWALYTGLMEEPKVT